MRVICHLDLDCFYCQVEHIRIGIASTEPLAVQQWNAVIAVNYPARSYGVKRGMTVKEVRAKCPTIHLIHVELVGNNSISPTTKTPSASTSKVSLERYRLASESIMSIFQRFSPLCERASIDEAYLDLTERVNAPSFDSLDDDSLAVDEDQLTTVDGSTLKGYNQEEIIFRRAAMIVYQLRETVRQELGYTVSAGIAANKLLAKQASACRKPNKQTIVLSSSIDSLMQELDVNDVRGLGGKLGDALIQRTNVKKAKDIQTIDLETLCSMFGDKTGPWIYKICRGIDEEPVKSNLKQKSLLACKSFTTPVQNIHDMKPWVNILCEDVNKRMHYDRKNNNRYPRSIGISARTPGGHVSKSGPLPSHGKELSDEDLVKATIALLAKVPSLYPCGMLQIGVSDMVDLPLPNRKTIASFLVSGSPTTPTKNEGNSCDSLHNDDVSLVQDLSREDNGESTGQCCPLCGERMPSDKISQQAHSDYHVALSLQVNFTSISISS